MHFLGLINSESSLINAFKLTILPKVLLKSKQENPVAQIVFVKLRLTFFIQTRLETQTLECRAGI